MTNRKARVTELIQRELSSILARDHAFPDVLVTVTDVDLTPDFKNAHIFIGVIGPAAKQQAVVDKLVSEVNKVLLLDDFGQALANAGMNSAKPGKPEIFDAFFKQELTQWTKVVKDAGIKLE